jgi:hypothetical protein
MAPFYSRTDKELAEYNISRMGISDLKRKCYRELSGYDEVQSLKLFNIKIAELVCNDNI